MNADFQSKEGKSNNSTGHLGWATPLLQTGYSDNREAGLGQQSITNGVTQTTSL